MPKVFLDHHWVLMYSIQILICPSFDREMQQGVKISPLFQTEKWSILRSVGLRNFFKEYVIKHFLHILHPQHTIKWGQEQSITMSDLSWVPTVPSFMAYRHVFFSEIFHSTWLCSLQPQHILFFHIIHRFFFPVVKLQKLRLQVF